MMNFKKRLSINIDDTREDEEEIQLAQITQESMAHGFFKSSYIENRFNLHDEEKHKIYELNNPFVNGLLQYMEKENCGSDFSFFWLNRIHNLAVISKPLHFTTMSEVDKVNGKRDFNCEFKLIKLLTEDKKHKENLVKIKKPLNKNNRYSDLLPYAYNIALINSPDEGTGTDAYLEENYINASYIDGPLPEDNKFFIATQGPLSSTVSKFWKLVFNKNVKLIVMLCNLEEDSRKKCEQYWPTKRGTIKTYDGVDVYLEKEEFIIKDSLIKREITIRFWGVEKKVVHLQMVSWSDHMPPEEDTGYISIEYILSYMNEYKYNFHQSPILTHCSAGTGRTGTIIAIYNLVRSLNIVKYFNFSGERSIKPFYSVFNIVRKLREQRMSMVSSNTQYKFIYEFAGYWIKRHFELE